jgi:2-methylcitrate dehydratase
MATNPLENCQRTRTDGIVQEIVHYTLDYKVQSEEAYRTARLALMDTLGCAMAALEFDACARLLGPLVPGMQTQNGALVPGTDYRLDPVQAAFNLGAMIRWLDYNDTWLAAEWGHPSDNLGGILMSADWAARTAQADGRPPLKMSDALTAAIKAYEIQGCLALENSFNRAGLDHVLLVRVATAAVVTAMLGGSREQVTSAVTNAWADGGSLRVYRHAPNTGSRKSWAAGDATSRGVRLALLALRGEMGYPSVLSAPTWGFYDALFRGREFRLPQPFDTYVMENVLFKISFPAEFHAQTAVEAALQLHPLLAGRLERIEKVRITTQESAMRIIDKRGPLRNPADRDHCIQYAAAVALIFGRLTASDYEDSLAADARIDALRAKTEVVEDPAYSRDYLDPAKRSIANSVQVFFADGSQTPKIEVLYPLGHRRRREEAVPLLRKKFHENLAARFSAGRVAELEDLFADPSRLDAMPVSEFSDQWAAAARIGRP